MREAVGGTFLFNLMIIFIFFFAAFLAIAINYSQAFKVKNQVISIIEQYEGVNSESSAKIFEIINDSGYYREVKCNCSEIKCNNPTTDNQNGAEIVNNNKSVHGVCVRRIQTGDDAYYRVTTYVNFKLPMIGTFLNIPIKGETKVITNEVYD